MLTGPAGGSAGLTGPWVGRNLACACLEAVVMTDEELRQAIRQKARDGKVACKVLLALAAETDTPPRRIGQLCNEMKIKITACQLGCFG